MDERGKPDEAAVVHAIARSDILRLMPVSSPSSHILKGSVVADLGNVAYRMTLLGEIYRQKTGLRLFPGTLNLDLKEPWRVPRALAIRIEKEEYGGSVSWSLVPCRVFGSGLHRSHRCGGGEHEYLGAPDS